MDELEEKKKGSVYDLSQLGGEEWSSFRPGSCNAWSRRTSVNNVALSVNQCRLNGSDKSIPFFYEQEMNVKGVVHLWPDTAIIECDIRMPLIDNENVSPFPDPTQLNQHRLENFVLIMENTDLRTGKCELLNLEKEKPMNNQPPTRPRSPRRIRRRSFIGSDWGTTSANYESTAEESSVVTQTEEEPRRYLSGVEALALVRERANAIENPTSTETSTATNTETSPLSSPVRRRRSSRSGRDENETPGKTTHLNSQLLSSPSASCSSSLKEMAEIALLEIKDPVRAVQLICELATISDRVVSHCIGILVHLPLKILENTYEKVKVHSAQLNMVKNMVEERKQNFPLCKSMGVFIEKATDATRAYAWRGMNEDGDENGARVNLCYRIAVYVPLPLQGDGATRERITFKRLQILYELLNRMDQVKLRTNGNEFSRNSDVVKFIVKNLSYEELYPSSMLVNLFEYGCRQAVNNARCLGLDVLGISKLNLEGRMRKTNRYSVRARDKIKLSSNGYSPIEWRVNLLTNFFYGKKDIPLPESMVLIKDPRSLLLNLSPQFDKNN